MGMHTSDPPNPLGHDLPEKRKPGEPTAAIVAVTQAGPGTPFVLAVPRTWTRLVVAVVTLLFLVVILVSFMVYLSWRSAQLNTQRIIELDKRLGEVEGKANEGKVK